MTVFLALSVIMASHCESSLGSRDEYSTTPGVVTTGVDYTKIAI